MLSLKTVMCATFLTFNCYVMLEASYADTHLGDGDDSSIGIGSFSPHLLGHYAGAAASHWHLNNKQEGQQTIDYDSGSHEENVAFAAAAAEHYPEYETLSSSYNHGDDADDYQHHNHIDSADTHMHLNEIHLNDDDDDFLSKPVPGIDHGKGAFSWSTLYEFKEPHY